MGGFGGRGGFGGVGGYGRNNMFGANLRLQNEKQTGNLKLNYERALWQERLQRAQLEAQLQYGTGVQPLGAYGMNGLGAQQGLPGGFGVVPGAGFGGFGQGLGGFGAGMLGALGLGGQSNVNNQTGTATNGTLNQSVANSNSFHDSGNTYVMGGGGGLFGGGNNWMSGLLNWF
ncbi:MAG TPA: hypothetical protein VNM48_08595 [Chloroflexota bacterium]|nr:hypothetical protein [Chloroflexota bacterium]